MGVQNHGLRSATCSVRPPENFVWPPRHHHVAPGERSWAGIRKQSQSFRKKAAASIQCRPQRCRYRDPGRSAHARGRLRSVHANGCERRYVRLRRVGIHVRGVTVRTPPDRVFFGCRDRMLGSNQRPHRKGRFDKAVATPWGRGRSSRRAPSIPRA